jgi:hypothetical protein
MVLSLLEPLEYNKMVYGLKEVGEFDYSYL